ncbi:single-stranded-DNA-specific exonuclease RecJ [Psychrosphaera ytuae]|uniref:Single-stranded-DNA-specific exonuclease RecJ n=1 Tax=Psychrosphaera ytuae TaxID=2820710 RepID=A0A975DEU7_9GAMM|nr:single-stranded-DNA-specific exonuclease RecJ [Psychrosphaera ytuae]QTH65111.1 single-stranded-DNA-specific exonuclease RecJ [Psychrosphaera ytuae]
MSLNIQRRVTSDTAFSSELHPVIAKIYSGRGITNPSEIKRKAGELLPVSTLKGIDDAVPLLHEALLQQQHITIVGDFDADGATSTALMMLGLRKLGFTRVSYKVPNRFDYGYGLSPELANDLIKTDTDLIITVDNGISCIAGIDIVKSAGIKVIVTDHHLAGHILPNADAIINPNQPGCEFASKNIAGVGVAFYLLLGFRAYLRDQGYYQSMQITPPNLAEYIDLVALGTVADVVKLDTNNRILVHQGLARIKSGLCRPGIRALLAMSNKDLNKVKSSDFGFVIGPRLNAAGRLDDMSFGIRCLLTEDYGQALKMAEDLNDLNNERKDIEQGMRLEAEAVVNDLTLSEGDVPAGICVYKPDWHQGVIGIVAGRLKEKYYRPTIAFAKADVSATGDSELKGSARSIPGLHIRDILDEVNTKYPGVILKFGGHAMAAGLSIIESKLAEFQSAFETVLNQHLTEDVLTQVILTDGELPADCFTVDFCQQLADAGPWGQGFAEPTFDGVFTIINQRLVGAKHLKLVLSDRHGQLFDGIHFNADLSQWPNPHCDQAQIVYQLDINEFRGNINVQLLVRDITQA